jgi:hypothetical protein
VCVGVQSYTPELSSTMQVGKGFQERRQAVVGPARDGRAAEGREEGRDGCGWDDLSETHTPPLPPILSQAIADGNVTLNIKGIVVGTVTGVHRR